MDPILLAMTLLASQPATTESDVVCGKRDAILSSLSKEYSEMPKAAGLANNGTVIELLTSNDGKTWTIVMTRPSGTSCVIAAGEAWQGLPDQVAGRPM